MSSLCFSNFAEPSLRFVDFARVAIEFAAPKIYLKLSRKGLTVNGNLRTQIAYENNSKSIAVGYLLWLFLGVFGVHRFYAGKTKSGVAQLILLLIPIVGWIALGFWLLADLFLIPGMIRDHNVNVLNMIHAADGGAEPRTSQAAHRRPMSEAERKREAMLEDLRSIGYRKERRDTSHLYR